MQAKMRAMRVRVWAAYVASWIGLAAVSGCESARREPARTPVDAAQDAQEAVSSPGAFAPDFSARDLAGGTFQLSDHFGHEVVFLDFWSPSCGPCRAELPALRELYARHKSEGLLVVGVSMDDADGVAALPDFVKRFHIDYPVVLDDDARVARLYDPKGVMPLGVLIARDGRITAVHEGYDPSEAPLLSADVARALGGATPAP